MLPWAPRQYFTLGFAPGAGGLAEPLPLPRRWGPCQAVAVAGLCHEASSALGAGGRHLPLGMSITATRLSTSITGVQCPGLGFGGTQAKLPHEAIQNERPKPGIFKALLVPWGFSKEDGFHHWAGASWPHGCRVGNKYLQTDTALMPQLTSSRFLGRL